MRLGTPLLTLALCLTSCGKQQDAATCLTDDEFFEQEVYRKVLQPVCATCPTRGGAARDSNYILENSARPDYLEVNEQMLAGLAGLQRDGESVVLRKPLGLEDHGGGAVLAEDSDEYAILTEYVERLDDPVTKCPGDDEVSGEYGVANLNRRRTLRKASMLLVGRFPTPQELDEVSRGGDQGLREVLREMMGEEAFVERMQELYNDVLLTDAYTNSYDGVALLDYDRYPTRYWFEASTDSYEVDRRNASSFAISREPLALLGHILRNDLPYTELLTADYVMVNDYSANSYGIGTEAMPDPNNPDTFVFRKAQLDGVQHAGILTTAAFLNRYPTTDTNRNRHRTWAFMKKFLATDLLQFADRPIDLLASDAHNPTLNDPQCNVCHAVMDPVAGLFQNWDDNGALNPLENGWYPDMSAPGFEAQPLPAGDQSTALKWLGQQAIQDDRFAVSTVRTVLSAVTGLELLEARDALLADDLYEAHKLQNDFVNTTADAFVASNHDLKMVVEEVVMSRYFRGVQDVGATPGELVLAGTAHMLTPEEYNRKVVAATGYRWARWDGDYMLGRYRLLYGGIDSDGVVERLNDPNGIIANIAMRVATQVTCRAIPQDFSLPPDQRRMVPLVEPTHVPETAEGFAVAEAEQLIRDNLVYLFEVMLDEHHGPNDPEIEAAYQLWYDVWIDGRNAVAAGEVDDDLFWECRANDFAGDNLPSDMQVNWDGDYTMRAWMAIVNYLMTDYRFLYE